MPGDYCAADEIKEELLEFKDEEIDEFADIKQEESVLDVPLPDTFHAIKEEPFEYKDEPFGFFMDIKEEEPIGNMISPYTETSFPRNLSTSMEIPCIDIAE
ncbi:hypothetical protein PMAYCL1PPCAC_20814, partial [Pristionchus mayeri]